MAPPYFANTEKKTEGEIDNLLVVTSDPQDFARFLDLPQSVRGIGLDGFEKQFFNSDAILDKFQMSKMCHGVIFFYNKDLPSFRNR